MYGHPPRLGFERPLSPLFTCLSHFKHTNCKCLRRFLHLGSLHDLWPNQPTVVLFQMKCSIAGLATAVEMIHHTYCFHTCQHLWVSTDPNFIPSDISYRENLHNISNQYMLKTWGLKSLDWYGISDSPNPRNSLFIMAELPLQGGDNSVAFINHINLPVIKILLTHQKLGFHLKENNLKTKAHTPHHQHHKRLSTILRFEGNNLPNRIQLFLHCRTTDLLQN